MTTMKQLSLIEQARIEDPQRDDGTLVANLAAGMIDELQERAPIDLEVVASYQGVAAIERRPLLNAGCLITDLLTGRVSIWLRSSDGTRRQRFTGFHEIVHTFMPGFRLETQHRCDPSVVVASRRKIEQLCDIGASELLLPRRQFREDLAAASFGLTTVVELADAYDASLQATAHRFVDLWPEATLLVVADVMNKPRDDQGAEPKLRVRYSTGRGAWPFILRHKSIDPGQPLARALAGEVVDELTTLRGICNTEMSGLFVSARCFPYVDGQGAHHDRVLALYRRPAPHG